MPKKMVFTYVAALMVLAGSFNVMAAERGKAKPSPDQALEMLQQGNARFSAGKSIRPHQNAARLTQAGTEDQADSAYATIMSCSDSRVPVEIIFDAGIMDIFLVSVAGNVIQTDEAGSIEYGLAHVRTPLLVVLGHTQCGAVIAVVDQLQGHGHALERNIPPLVAPIAPAVKRAMKKHPALKGSAVVPATIEENVWQGIEDLFLRSPVTLNMAKAGKVKVVGAIYDVGSGQVKWLPQENVAQILAKVEADPKRPTNPMAQ